MHADIVFIAPWRPLEFDLERTALPKQLAIEISPNHPLWRRECTVIGRAGDNDDILVACSDGTYAIVHLMWSRGPGDKDYPTTTIFASAQSVNDVIWREAAFFGSIENVDWNDERLRIL